MHAARRFPGIAALAALIGFFAAAQSSAESVTARAAPADSIADPEAEGISPSWAVGLYVNMIPDNTYLLPTAAMSWGKLYAEARYQYEDLETASVWCGRSFAGEGPIAWWVAPMVGVAFGRTNGLAPGLVVELGWRRFSFSTSAEYLFDLEDEGASFFYDWTEWIVEVHDRFSTGITIERSRPRDTDLTLNTGLTLYSSVRGLTLSFYGFNVWDGEDDYYVMGIGREF